MQVLRCVIQGTGIHERLSACLDVLRMWACKGAGTDGFDGIARDKARRTAYARTRGKRLHQRVRTLASRHTIGEEVRVLRRR